MSEPKRKTRAERDGLVFNFHETGVSNVNQLDIAASSPASVPATQLITVSVPSIPVEISRSHWVSYVTAGYNYDLRLRRISFIENLSDLEDSGGLCQAVPQKWDGL
jgi:hypothetical protein